MSTPESESAASASSALTSVYSYRVCRPTLHDQGENHQPRDDVMYFVVLDGALAGVYLSEEVGLDALQLTPGGGTMLTANGWTDSRYLWARQCVFEHDHEDRSTMPGFVLKICRPLQPINIPDNGAEGLLWAIPEDSMLFGTRAEALRYISANGLNRAALRSFPASRIFPSLGRE
uniref:AraC family transcriptional regulator n=1 Tax=Mycena chlorophos TaxID=658473 RepID=A0ABQ0L0K4_MYCCL|nr:predicted protein [Mycena chlorophos]